MSSQRLLFSLLLANFTLSLCVLADTALSVASSSRNNVSISSSRSLSSLQSRNSSTDSISFPTSHGIGEAILSGIGQEQSSTLDIALTSDDVAASSISRSVSRISSSFLSTITSSPSHSSIIYTATASGNRSLGTSESLFDCQSAWVAWSISTDAVFSPYVDNITRYQLQTTQVTIQYGAADVYTTEAGFARAHGSLSITSAAHYNKTSTDTLLTTSVFLTPSSLQNVSLSPPPDCTIDASSCNLLWKSYSSDGGDYDSTVWPVPTNSPRCRITMTGCIETYIDSGCNIVAKSAQLFYWPKSSDESTTSAINATHLSVSVPRTTIISGITMTSPSIYLSFDSLSAVALTLHNYRCGTGAGNLPLTHTVGSTIKNAVVAIDPNDVSSLEKTQMNGAVFPDSAIQAMASPSGTAYQSWALAIANQINQVIAKPLSIEDLTKPPPRAYYLRPVFYETSNGTLVSVPYAPGCSPSELAPACNTIFDDVYRAQLVLPSTVKELDPAWSVCSTFGLGVYDPPYALSSTEDVLIPALSTSTSALTRTPASPASAQFDPTVSSTVLVVVSTLSSPVALQSAPDEIVPMASSTKQMSAGSDQADPDHAEAGNTAHSASTRLANAVSQSVASTAVDSFQGLTNLAVDLMPPDAPTTDKSPGFTTLTQVTAHLTASNALQALFQTFVSVAASAIPSSATIVADQHSLRTELASQISGNGVSGSTIDLSGHAAGVNSALVSTMVQPTESLITLDGTVIVDGTTQHIVVGSRTLSHNESLFAISSLTYSPDPYRTFSPSAGWTSSHSATTSRATADTTATMTDTASGSLVDFTNSAAHHAVWSGIGLAVLSVIVSLFLSNEMCM